MPFIKVEVTTERKNPMTAINTNAEAKKMQLCFSPLHSALANRLQCRVKTTGACGNRIVTDGGVTLPGSRNHVQTKMSLYTDQMS